MVSLKVPRRMEETAHEALAVSSHSPTNDFLSMFYRLQAI